MSMALPPLKSKLFANQAVGQGESLVVSYDPAFSNASFLMDASGNQVAAFQQAVNNSSKQPLKISLLPTSPLATPIHLDCHLLDFDEQLQQLDAQQLDSLTSSLRIVVDGRELQG